MALFRVVIVRKKLPTCPSSYTVQNVHLYLGTIEQFYLVSQSTLNSTAIYSAAKQLNKVKIKQIVIVG